jgi:CRP/FNR family cyclic AMP-dependent transcriptional regulator
LTGAADRSDALGRSVSRDMIVDSVPPLEGGEAAGRYLLRALQEPDRDLVIKTGNMVLHQNRDYLVRQDEIGNGIHILMRGMVESTYCGPQGRELMLATWHSGDFVGAPYVLGDHRHNWSAQAVGRVEALHLDQNAIRRLIAQSPGFAVALIECLGFKGETYSMLAQTLGGQKVAERLVLLLVKLSENAVPDANGSIRLGRITQANLARMIGATRQSISLVLCRLQDEGIVTTAATTMIVNDLPALRRQLAD